MTAVPAPELPIMVTREMIEAHYKSIMTTARNLMRDGNTAHAYKVLGEACSRPYPTPAPASMPEATDAVVWQETTADGEPLWDYDNFLSTPEHFDYSRPLYANPVQAHERIAALEVALHPFTKHNSSEPTVTITVPSAAVTRARSLLAEGDTP